MRGDRVNGAGGSTLRLALGPAEAAEAIGVSRRHFERHVLPHLRAVQSGARTLVSVRELERWLDAEAR